MCVLDRRVFRKLRSQSAPLLLHSTTVVEKRGSARKPDPHSHHSHSHHSISSSTLTKCVPNLSHDLTIAPAVNTAQGLSSDTGANVLRAPCKISSCTCESRMAPVRWNEGRAIFGTLDYLLHPNGATAVARNALGCHCHGSVQ